MTDFVISSLGDAAQNRSTTCAVLTWDKTKLCTEVTPVLECLAGTDSGHHGSRDQRTSHRISRPMASIRSSRDIQSS
jgi:hypothetical protein